MAKLRAHQGDLKVKAKFQSVHGIGQRNLNRGRSYCSPSPLEQSEYDPRFEAHRKRLNDALNMSPLGLPYSAL